MTMGESGNRTADRQRPSPWPELLLGLALFGLYSLIADMSSPERTAAADRNGRWIYDLERWLHIDFEPALNHWVAPHEVLRTLANYEYATTYVVAALATIVWLYRRRPDRYRGMRNSFILMTLIAFGSFAVFPVAPPRLLAGEPFIDTVLTGRTWGSWGSPLVAHANQLAAMPSLHLAWALWVSVVLAKVGSGRLVQLLSAVHVLITLFVITVTANHFLLDAVGGALAVWLGFVLLDGFTPRRDKVPAADSFFLYVESPVAAQHVGGLVVLDTSTATFSRAGLEATIRTHLHELPRFRQQLSPGSAWHGPRWVERDDLDWSWHVPVRDLTRPDGQPGGFAALHALVAELAATPMPRDRPLWRFVAVLGVEADRAAAVLIVHHVIADGVGTVAQALNLLEPRIVPDIPAQKAPGAARRIVGTVVGLAQLATDGRARMKLPTGNTPERCFATVDLPFDGVREVARRNRARISDVLLTVVAGALSREGTAVRSGLLRVAVPLMVRPPGAAAEGNLTAAVMTDLPLGPVADGEPARLAEIARRNRTLRSGTRALASNFVMRRVGAALPVPVHAWFARTVYGGRFFQAIVSNVPGVTGQLSLAGAPLAGVYPMLPLAPRAPLAVGALGWDGVLSVGIVADPALIGDVQAFADAMKVVYDDLLQGGSPGVPAPVLQDRG
jgi:diacylglycerol O-acyltransferase